MTDPRLAKSDQLRPRDARAHGHLLSPVFSSEEAISRDDRRDMRCDALPTKQRHETVPHDYSA